MPPALDSALDRLVAAADNALRTLTSAGAASRPCPVPAADPAAEALGPAERRLSGALMRVNHVGEVCAQALYNAQALAARDPELRRRFEQASREETDHLAWTRQRLRELGSRASVLNPLWYAGAFGIGWLAGQTSDRLSLGFVVETERQVEGHLDEHLERLPEEDAKSRAIVAQMRIDEGNHAEMAQRAGAADLPTPIKRLMKLQSRVMTTVAYWV